jgi:hypothetical protein
MRTETLKAAHELWQAGKELEAGRAVFEAIPEEARPGWAARILKAVVARTGLRSPAIDRIIWVAGDSRTWLQGHAAFQAARNETLRLDEIPARSPAEELMLHQVVLAELVAKVTYNATNPEDGFNEDSGWWIGRCLRDVLEAAGDADFAASAWSLLTEGRATPDQ